MVAVPQLKKKQHNWSKIGEDSLLLALFWDQVADPGSMDATDAALNLEGLDMYLERYIVIPTGGKDPQSVDDLRELEHTDLGPGVVALWSDKEKSVLAFAFMLGMYTEEQARQWVQDAKALSGREGKEGLALRSFEETRNLVWRALEAQYGIDPDSGDYSIPRPSVWEIGPQRAIVSYKEERYAVPYTIGEDGTVEFGEREPVEQVWRKVEDQAPVVLLAFSLPLGDGAEAEGDDDGLVWKEILHPGEWFKTNSGKRITVTKNIIEEAFRAFQAGLPKYVSVPTDHHHISTNGIVPPEGNRGFVKRLKLLGNRLFAGFDFTKEDVKAGVLDGSIADCSVYLQPSVTHNATGEKFGWVLRHVLLTNDPLVSDLEGFGAIPASGGQDGVTLFTFAQHFQKREVAMPEQAETIQLSAEEYARLQEFQGLGLTAEEIRDLAAQREAIAAQASQLRARARDQEITAIVAAMQGQGEHPSVEQVEGRVHYPVFCAAVETALRELPPALALDASEDGTTPLDSVIMALVNAVPEDGRMAVGEQPTPRKDPVATSAAGDKRQLTDEELKARMRERGLLP